MGWRWAGPVMFVTSPFWKPPFVAGEENREVLPFHWDRGGRHRGRLSMAIAGGASSVEGRDTSAAGEQDDHPSSPRPRDREH